jgi:hypothetical protein
VREIYSLFYSFSAITIIYKKRRTPALQSLIISPTTSHIFYTQESHLSSSSAAVPAAPATHCEYHSFITTHVVPDTQVPDPVQPEPPHWEYWARIAPDAVDMGSGAELVDELTLITFVVESTRVEDGLSEDATTEDNVDFTLDLADVEDDFATTTDKVEDARVEDSVDFVASTATTTDVELTTASELDDFVDAFVVDAGTEEEVLTTAAADETLEPLATPLETGLQNTAGV